MIIAVDFDGTLYLENGTFNYNLISRLKANQRNGDMCILWTCREGTRLNEAILMLKTVGFFPNLINENHPAIVKKFGYNPRKIYADLYIDDKGVR